jgi:caffeoyl-CoA O-methyltransferase
MLDIVSEEIRRYCDANTTADSPASEGIAHETHARTLRAQMLVGREEGTFLTLIARSTGARRIVEIGTFTGYSALKLAEGLPADGEVITCDVNAETTAIAKKFWAMSPHGHKIKLKLGPALETLETLSGPFDVVFVDADKSNYINYWEACVPKLRTGGVILVDNVLWSGRVLKPSEEDDFAIAAFNSHAARDGRVDRVMLTMRDGILMACKR